jgi:hypothetical protein
MGGVLQTIRWGRGVYRQYDLGVDFRPVDTVIQVGSQGVAGFFTGHVKRA